MVARVHEQLKMWKMIAMHMHLAAIVNECYLHVKN